MTKQHTQITNVSIKPTSNLMVYSRGTEPEWAIPQKCKLQQIFRNQRSLKQVKRMYGRGTAFITFSSKQNSFSSNQPLLRPLLRIPVVVAYESTNFIKESVNYDCSILRRPHRSSSNNRWIFFMARAIRDVSSPVTLNTTLTLAATLNPVVFFTVNTNRFRFMFSDHVPGNIWARGQSPGYGGRVVICSEPKVVKSAVYSYRMSR